MNYDHSRPYRLAGSGQWRAVVKALENVGLSPGPVFIDKAESAPDSKGAYGLLLRMVQLVEIELREAGPFGPGLFVYCGSANGPGGLHARLRRHFRATKTPRWHVDRLTVAAGAIAAVTVSGGHECRLVERLLRSSEFEIAIRGFGSSDCRTCESHLLRYRGQA